MNMHMGQIEQLLKYWRMAQFQREIDNPRAYDKDESYCLSSQYTYPVGRSQNNSF